MSLLDDPNETTVRRHPSPVVTDMALLLKAAPAGMQRVDRDDYGLAVAHAVALRADCTRRRVGAVILNPEGRVVGGGYNGLAPGRPGCATSGACPRGRLSYEQVPGGETATAAASYAPGTAGSCEALHAEMNAVIDAGRPRAKGCTIYVTDEPCYMCRLVIRAAGIARVVWPAGEWRP